MPQPVLFLHIPKTAGTAVVRHLEKNTLPQERRPIYEGTALDRDFETILRNKSVKAIYGHFYWRSTFRDQGLYSFTFLRKPQQREVSNYLFICSSSDPGHRRWRQEWRNFGDYLRSKQAFNRQTRMLSGMGAFLYFQEHQEEALQKAQESLKFFNRIGFQENFHASLKAISEDLGWDPPAREIHNSGKQRLRARWLLFRYQKELDRVTRLDQALYAYASRLEDERLPD